MSKVEPIAKIRPYMQKNEGYSAGWIGSLLFYIYNIRNDFLRRLVRAAVRKLEGGDFYSLTLRRIFTCYHNTTIGLYTHGGCFMAGQLRPRTTVGRYSSIAIGVTAHLNHPGNLKSTHAFFFDPLLGYAKDYIMQKPPLTIGNDVWIGSNAIILPSVTSIGDGAIIGAGTVVHKNIPPYAVVVGNPGQIVRFRFSKERIKELIESRWWDRSIEELTPELDSFQQQLEGEAIR